MDSGNEIETKDKSVQPDEVVVTDSEITEAKPQADDTEQEEFFVDVEEGDQEKPKSGMTQEQAYAAFQKEKRKRKDKQTEIDKEKAERERLERELKELKSTVSEITRGEMPDPYDFEDKHEYYKALKQWEGQSPPSNKQPKEEQPKSQDNTAADEAEFYLYQREQELTKALPGYADAKQNVINKMQESYGVKDPTQTMVFLSHIAKQSGVDIAKAVFAMEAAPSLIDELNGVTDGNQFALAKILEKAAGKVKTRTKQKVDTLPEPEVNNSGPIDVNSAKIEKLRQVWVTNPNRQNYDAYNSAKQQSKKKVKENG